MPKPEPVKVKARLFKNGRSQAVRLPKSLRFDSEEVYLWRDGDRVILEPVPAETWPPGYWEMVDSLARDLDVQIEPLAPALLDVDLE